MIKAQIQAYEDLIGGRETHYRLERISSPNLRSEVQFGLYTGKLVNYTALGVAFTLPSSVQVTRDQLLDCIQITIGYDVLYKGPALVRHTQALQTDQLVGVLLISSPLDLDLVTIAKVRKLSEVRALQASQVDLDPRYKTAVSDAVFLMNSYRKLLGEQEVMISQIPLGDVRNRIEQETLAGAEVEFRKEYDPLRLALNSLAPSTSKCEPNYKRYTEAMFHPCVLGAPAAHRCYCKPLGYPGDYLLMDHLYSDERRGESLYDKLIHQVVVREEPLADAVRHRKNFMMSQIRQAVMAKSEGLPQVLSLGCGSAQEVLEYLSGSKPQEVRFTLVDQDQQALNYVSTRLAGLSPHHSHLLDRVVNIGFKQLLTQNGVFDSTPYQNLIYTAGLFDYLTPRIAQRLAQRLFQKVSLGGTLAIGNFKAPTEVAWSLEYWMDWPLIYRTMDDMLEIASLIDEKFEREVTLDASGYTYVLLIHKNL